VDIEVRDRELGGIAERDDDANGDRLTGGRVRRDDHPGVPAIGSTVEPLEEERDA
jgi:hypothetical protein